MMEAREYTFIKRRVLTLTGVDLNCYKAPQVQRRLRTYLLRSGYPNWPSLFRSIQDDESELNKLKDYLTINVTPSSATLTSSTTWPIPYCQSC
jgi:chemotaxis protein methyltransferase CheR